MTSRCFNASWRHPTWRHSSCSRAADRVEISPFGPQLRHASDYRGLPARHYHCQANSKTSHQPQVQTTTPYGVHANTRSRQMLYRWRFQEAVHARFGTVARPPSVGPVLIACERARVAGGPKIGQGGGVAVYRTQERGFRLSSARLNAKSRAR